jgi:pyruvate/2-oxoglutarate dehydrogenase complex dihydrolipoamide acyltransferase (E2) component
MAEAPIVVPELGEQIARVRVSKWLVPINSRVEVDQAVVAISTEKIDVDLVAPIAGTLAMVHVPEGEVVAIGTTLGVITSS